MKLIVGYQLREDGRFADKIVEQKAKVSEVYFAWPGIANGRSTLSRSCDLSEREAVEHQTAELTRFHREGIALNLLLNGNCYGTLSLSRAFFRRLGGLIDDLVGTMGLESITTASPIVAKFVKQNFPELEVRASVNMEIGTREGVEYLADVMDGFYVKRELNRQIGRVKAFSDICRSMSKRVYLLANSGCLNYCSARTFHDNLVSHEEEIMAMDNGYEFHGVCRSLLSNPANKRRIISLSNWIRPEDLSRYDDLVDGAKLATRVSERPEMILEAYAAGRFSGNLLELTEPDFSALYKPRVLNADAIPEDFFKKTSCCSGNCAVCGYCMRVYDQASLVLPEDVIF